MALSLLASSSSLPLPPPSISSSKITSPLRSSAASLASDSASLATCAWYSPPPSAAWPALALLLLSPAACCCCCCCCFSPCSSARAAWTGAGAGTADPGAEGGAVGVCVLWTRVWIGASARRSVTRCLYAARRACVSAISFLLTRRATSAAESFSSCSRKMERCSSARSRCRSCVAAAHMCFASSTSRVLRVLAFRAACDLYHWWMSNLPSLTLRSLITSSVICFASACSFSAFFASRFSRNASRFCKCRACL
mmetsp:Transcript_33250/g.78324  ORF Transcript_33250/g.78324 Transcript_33250/m.78324 type:complete len:253 (-) Transcript_33250:623-1381(-)